MIVLKKVVIQNIFNQEPEVFESHSGKIFVVHPLCGSRTFHTLSQAGAVLSIPPANAIRAQFTITRRESKRLITAYNKKIIASDDWRKKFLRYGTGIKYNCTFEEMMLNLIEQKESGIFIDKHFKPNKMYGRRVLITDYEKISQLLNVDMDLVQFTKTRSSNEIIGSRAKINLTESERTKVLEYLRLF